MKKTSTILAIIAVICFAAAMFFMRKETVDLYDAAFPEEEEEEEEREPVKRTRRTKVEPEPVIVKDEVNAFELIPDISHDGTGNETT